MANIFELKYQYLQLQNFIDDGNLEGFELALEQIEDNIFEKLESYAKVIKNIESDIDGVSKEIKRMQERKKQMELSIQRMKAVMKDTLLTVEGNRVKGKTFNFSLRRTASVKINNEDLIPIEYKIEQPMKLDKALIKDFIKKGTDVPGAEITNNLSIQIK